MILQVSCFLFLFSFFVNYVIHTKSMVDLRLMKVKKIWIFEGTGWFESWDSQKAGPIGHVMSIWAHLLIGHQPLSKLHNGAHDLKVLGLLDLHTYGPIPSQTHTHIIGTPSNHIISCSQVQSLHGNALGGVDNSVGLWTIRHFYIINISL